ncbi:MAG: hypothetical protein ACTHWH_05885 [Marinobacter sp.]
MTTELSADVESRIDDAYLHFLQLAHDYPVISSINHSERGRFEIAARALISKVSVKQSTNVPEGWKIEATSEGSICVSHPKIGLYISRSPDNDSRILEILFHALATDLQKLPNQEQGHE